MVCGLDLLEELNSERLDFTMDHGLKLEAGSDFEDYDSLDSLCSIEIDEESLLLLDDVESEPKRRVKVEDDTTPQLIFSNTKSPSKAGLKRGRKESTKSGARSKKRKASSEDLLKSKKAKEEKVPYIPWSEIEDQKLKNIVQRKISELRTEENPEPDNTNAFPWGAISLRMTGRTPKQCRERWRNKLNPTIKQTPWTISEDITLMDMHSKLGNRWVLLASLLPGRTENSVKTRFKSIVRAKRRSWRQEEDEKVLELFDKIGGKWTEIAASLPNRTANGVKVRLKHLTNGKKEEKPEAGSPFQSFGIDMPEVIRKNEKFLKEYLERERKGNGARRSLKSRPQFATPSMSDDVENRKPHSPVHMPYDPLLDSIHPSAEKTKAHRTQAAKRSKGTRALIMDSLQNNDDYGSNFASTIATMLKPSDKCNTEAGFFTFEAVKVESHGFEAIGA